jgi:TIR domain
MTTEGPGVFLSYRRKEPGHAGRLHDRLVEDLGEDRVFMDVDSIRPGEDWIEAISRALAKCAVMLVLIGDQWGQVRSERAAHGDSDDPVLFEIDAAFDQGIQIIPVLLDDAVMPRNADLPDTLVRLSHLHAMRVRHDTFKSDAARLVTVVQEALDAYQKAGSRTPSVLDGILAPHETRKAASDPADQMQPGGEIGASPSTGGRSEGPPAAARFRPRVSLARRLLVPLLTLVSLVAIVFAAWIFTTTRTDLAAAEEIAEPIGTAVNPFLEGVGQDVPQTRPPNAAGPVTGDTEGLYGGTRRGTSCDTAKLVAFLQAHPDKGAAWAGVLKLTLQQIPSFVAELTPLILRADTRVTNHGFKNGKVTSFPSIFQAGTAVLVDKQGVPVVKCYCGNPLTPPRPVAHRYQGNAWPGFDAQKVIVIKPAPTAVKTLTVVDQTTGKKFSKETGAKVPPANPEQPEQTDGTASPKPTDSPTVDDTPPPTPTETAISDDTASPTPTETATTDDTANPTPTETPSPEDTATESKSVSPPESDTSDPSTGGDSQDAGDSRGTGQGTDSGQDSGENQGSTGGGQTEENGGGEPQAGTDSGEGSDTQQGTGTNGGAATTNPDTG